MEGEGEDGQSGWVDADNVIEHGLRECIVLDLEAFRRAERHKVELFLRKMKTMLYKYISSWIKTLFF